jgi:hypothetical protein
VPLAVTDPGRVSLFSTASSRAFSYSGAAYMPHDSLANGKGYWVKFPSSHSFDIAGAPRLSDTLTVVRGWNMVGSLSDAIPAGTITSDPPDIIQSLFFGYAGRYTAADTLEPGKGYWVKVSGEGKLVLRAVP